MDAYKALDIIDNYVMSLEQGDEPAPHIIGGDIITAFDTLSRFLDRAVEEEVYATLNSR